MAKFNKSKDGVMRTTVRHVVEMRLTEEELERYNRMARIIFDKDLRGFLNDEMPHPLQVLEEKFCFGEAES